MVAVRKMTVRKATVISCGCELACCERKRTSEQSRARMFNVGTYHDKGPRGGIVVVNEPPDEVNEDGAGHQAGQQLSRANGMEAVSYTHLTLPTIYSV